MCFHSKIDSPKPDIKLLLPAQEHEKKETKFELSLKLFWGLCSSDFKNLCLRVLLSHLKESNLNWFVF